jgi:hypothetical protein
MTFRIFSRPHHSRVKSASVSTPPVQTFSGIGFRRSEFGLKVQFGQTEPGPGHDGSNR